LKNHPDNEQNSQVEQDKLGQDKQLSHMKALAHFPKDLKQKDSGAIISAKTPEPTCSAR